MIFCFKSDILKYHLLLILPILVYFASLTLWFILPYLIFTLYSIFSVFM